MWLIPLHQQHEALAPHELWSAWNWEPAIAAGLALTALKHTIPGDLNHATLSDVKELMKGDGSGRVQR